MRIIQDTYLDARKRPRVDVTVEGAAPGAYVTVRNEQGKPVWEYDGDGMRKRTFKSTNVMPCMVDVKQLNNAFPLEDWDCAAMVTIAVRYDDPADDRYAIVGLPYTFEPNTTVVVHVVEP